MRSQNRSAAVTMADVAQRAGVSRALVSIVFRGVPGASEENRRRVMQAASELSYRPDQRAQLLGRNRSRTVGVVFGLHNEFHAEVVERLYQAAAGTDYQLALSPVAAGRSEEQAIQSLLDFRCEALILVGPFLPRAALEAVAGRLPVVVIGRALRSSTIDVVRTDDAVGAELAVAHLVALGHRRITHVEGQRAPGATERRRGYRRAMETAGLLQEVALVPGGLTEDAGARAADRLLSTDLPTAVFAFNDHCAAGLIAEFRTRSVRTPQDLSVIGYDNTGVARSATLSLSTIAQDARTLAYRALEIAIERSAEVTHEAVEVITAPMLILRATTAAAA
ncbi:LacI family transcriptional regulator [Jatrophihabitans sp. GAS493]|uniref:LacI family DNA-binding transcriptional regulator n=1 Tax=Jatrophihabitans sp. GAS493 TaxID=1907575 RepID=UPI000BB71293|nr:LacI family DNA-binding transcriptional regulator [Jatrophihabitans sp. GAS493]SOD73851.1 LacI family transcriptional regulator [Jatrophihabitans sp. GAS493]